MKKEAETVLIPTQFGDFLVRVWPEKRGQEPLALITPNLDTSKPVLVRIHSECLTGDTFGSLRCDCREQKDQSLKMIAGSGSGVFIYLRQEGRGIGLHEKIKAYKIQDRGYNTYEANIMLGHEADPREYSWAKKILDDLRINKVEIITNNPLKISALKDLGIEVTKQIELSSESNRHNEKYLKTKDMIFSAKRDSAL